MTRLYETKYATPGENIKAVTLTGIAGGLVFGEIFAYAPWLGGAIGGAIGFAIGWRFRYFQTKPRLDAPDSTPK